MIYQYLVKQFETKCNTWVTTNLSDMYHYTLTVQCIYICICLQAYFTIHSFDIPKYTNWQTGTYNNVEHEKKMHLSGMEHRPLVFLDENDPT